VIRWFVGYDPREAVALHVLTQSIIERSSEPVSVVPLALSTIRHYFDRPRDPLQSNDFSFSRFLVPFLCRYDGHAIFTDCDMLLRHDPAELWGLRWRPEAIQCVQHDHRPTTDRKYLGNVQTSYARKNWSSVMLLNCSKLRHWSPQYVETATGLELHQFRGIADHEIGSLPDRWNHLIGYSTPDDNPALVHWTDGGPWFREFAGVEFAGEWWQTYRRMRHADDAAAESL